MAGSSNYQVNIFNCFQDWLMPLLLIGLFLLSCDHNSLLKKGEGKSILSLHQSTFVAPFLGSLLRVVKVKFNPKS